MAGKYAFSSHIVHQKTFFLDGSKTSKAVTNFCYFCDEHEVNRATC